MINFDMANEFSEKLEDKQLSTEDKATIFLYLLVLEYRRYGLYHTRKIIMAMVDNIMNRCINEF